MKDIKKWFETNYLDGEKLGACIDDSLDIKNVWKCLVEAIKIARKEAREEMVKQLPLEINHVYRCWLENGSVMFADEGKFKITKE